MRPVLASLVPIALAAAVSAQPSSLVPMAEGALSELRGAAAERLTIADWIGAQVTGPSGDPVGTVRDLVAIPGGRLVAVVLELDDGSRIAAPYQVLKVSAASEALDLSLPVDAAALVDNAAVRELSDLLGL